MAMSRFDAAGISTLSTAIRCSDDIRKTSSHLLEYPESKPSDQQADGKVRGQPLPVRRISPNQDGARLLDDKGQRVQINPLAEVLWQRRDRVEDRRQE